MPDYIVMIRSCEILGKVIEAPNADEAQALARLEEWTPENGWGSSCKDASVVTVSVEEAKTLRIPMIGGSHATPIHHRNRQ